MKILIIIDRDLETGLIVFQNEIQRLKMKYTDSCNVLDEVNETVHKFSTLLLRWNEKQTKIKSLGTYKLKRKLNRDKASFFSTLSN